MSKKLIWAAAVGVSFLFGQQSVQAYQQYELKKQEQVRINKTAEQVRQKYMSLLPVRERWAERYPAESEVGDLVTMYNRMNLSFLGNAINTDQIYDLGREPYPQRGLGLVQACIGNHVQGMAMTFPNVRSTLNAMEQLESLPNITFSGVMLKQDNGQMALHTGKVCLLMRGGV